MIVTTIAFCFMWYAQITTKEAYDKQDALIHQANNIKTVSANSVVQAKEAYTEPIEAHYCINNVKVTAYDLSVQSCGKPIDSHGYGVTASGYDLSNQSREEAKTIAVDPYFIPLGTKVEVIFEDEHLQKYNGIYIARDTGSAIQGSNIDIFMGDFRSEYPAEETVDFGVQKANLKVFL